MEDQDRARSGTLAGLAEPLASLRAMGQQYRLRTPSTGREILVEAEPGQHLPRPRDGRAARDRRQAAAARAVAVRAAVGGGEPPVLQLVRPDGPEGPQRLPHVRPPHGRAPALTRPSATVRLLRSTLLFTVLALALAAAGCGGSGSDVPEVPGPPAELSVPHVKGAADLSEDASATPTPTPSADATETPTPATRDDGLHRHDRHAPAAPAPAPPPRPTPRPQQQDSASNDTTTPPPAPRRSSSSSSARRTPGAC